VPSGEGGFLYARVITSQLREQPLNTSVPGWEDQLAVTVTAAFDRDLRALTGGGTAEVAARHLLTALASSYGAGLPARDVWPALASALLSEGGYDDGDVDWVLQVLGRYVIESGEGGVAVYRLFHQELVDHLASDPDQGRRIDLAVGRLLVDQSGHGAHPGNVSPYVRRHAAAHLARAEWAGIAVLQSLAQEHRTLFLPGTAMALNDLAIRFADQGRGLEAIEAAQQATDAYRELAEADPEQHRPNLAAAVNNLAKMLSDNGRVDDAAHLAAEAVAIRRTLDPAVHRPSLAISASNLAKMLADQGRFNEALAAADEALAIHRELVGNEATTHLPGLAVAQINRARILAEMGSGGDALAAVDEAIGIYRNLDHLDPHAYQPGLAAALTNRGVYLGGLGRHHEALDSAEEAVGIQRQLEAAGAGTTHLPGLASALNNLADRYADLGRHAEAESAAAEAVRTYQQIPDSAAVIHLPDLAVALGTQARTLAALGRRAEALTVARDAVARCRALANERPAAYLPRLVASLTTLDNLLAELGESNDALQVGAEAVAIARVLAQSNPAAYLSALGTTLNNSAIQLSGSGRREEALTQAEETVRVYQLLARDNPAAHRPGLAVALNTLAKVFGDSDQFAAAIAPAREAVATYRDLVMANPGAYRPGLANALTSFADAIAHTGDAAGALNAAEEAASINRQLAEANSEVYLSRLAGSLNNLGIRLAEAGDMQRAAAVGQEAATVFRRLADAYPGAHSVGLARTLNNLSAHLARSGRGGEALAAAEESLTIYQRLAGGDAEPYLSGLAVALDNTARRLVELDQPQRARQLFADVLADIAGPTSQAYLQLSWADNRRDHGLVERFDHAAAGLDLLAGAEGHAPRHVAFAHRVMRELRSLDPDLFDQHWAPRFGGQPAWLTMPDSVVHAVTNWVNVGQRSWEESRAFAAEHPELLTREGATALQDVMLAHPGNPYLDLCAQVLDACRRLGVENAYAPLIARQTLQRWMAAGDWGESRVFLESHYETLTGPVGQAQLASLAENSRDPRLAVHWALLQLARGGRAERGYAYLSETDPERRRALLQAYSSDAGADDLAAFAVLASAYGADQRERADAWLLSAVHAAVTDNADLPVWELEGALPQLTADDRAGWMAALSRLVSAHRERSDALFAIIDLLARQQGPPYVGDAE
jgi:hypothetical protein